MFKRGLEEYPRAQEVELTHLWQRFQEEEGHSWPRKLGERASQLWLWVVLPLQMFPNKKGYLKCVWILKSISIETMIIWISLWFSIHKNTWDLWMKWIYREIGRSDELYKKVSYGWTFKRKKCFEYESSKPYEPVMLKHMPCVIDNVGVMRKKNERLMFHEIKLCLYSMWFNALSLLFDLE